MSRKIRQRSILAIIIYFLMITAIWAPIAFYTGRARGESEALRSLEPDQSLSHSGAATIPSGTDDASSGSDLVHAAFTVAAPAGASGAASSPRRTASGESPLRQAVLRAISETAGNGGNAGGDGGDQEVSPAQPFSLAMAPELAALTGGSAGTGRGGSTPGGNGYPGALVPGYLSVGGPGNPDGGGPQTPDLVTPVPAALPLMITGLAGLYAAAGRRRRA